MVDGVWADAWQARHAAPAEGIPVGTRRGAGLQPIGPGAQRRRGRRQRAAVVGGGQILEQDSPRHRVDDEMMNDEQETAALGEERGAHDRSVGDVEARLDPGGLRLDIR